MKTLITCLLLTVSAGSFAQDGYKFRTFNTTPCSNCGAIIKPGDKVPDTHPNAKYINDTTLWQWEEVGKEKVYGLKPQYLDTLIRDDGSVIKVPIWMKYPEWVKPEEKPNL